MAEAHFVARSAACGEVDQRAGDGGGGGDGDRGGAHHGMVQFAHAQGAYQQIDVGSVHGFAAGSGVIGGGRDEGDFRRVRTGGGFGHVVNQAHFQRTVSADFLEFFQRGGIVVDVVLQLFARVAQVGGVQENGRNARVDERGFQTTYTRNVQLVHQIAGREHTAFAVGGVEKFDLHFSGGKGNAVQLKIACFQDFAVLHRNMGDDGFADVFLPDFHRADAV